MHARRIFWKLYPSYLIVTMLALLSISLFSSSAIHQFYEKQIAGGLKVQSKLLVEMTHDLFLTNDLTATGEFIRMCSETSPARITLIQPDGTVIGDSDKDFNEMGNHRTRPEIQQALAGHVGKSVRYSNTLRKKMMYIAVPVYKDEKVIGVVRTSLPLTEIDQVIHAMQHHIFFGGLFILVLAALLSLLVSRRISRPLERIKIGAERFAQGDFSHRLNTVGSAEINALAETMNQMAEQLEERLGTVTKERNQREAVLSSMVEGVLAVDTTGHIISLNKAAAKFFAVFQPDTAKGRSVEEVFRNVKLQKFISDVLDGQETRECEITLHSGEATCLQTRGTNLYGVQGARIGAVVVFNDVSRLRRLENIRKEFVANVSHELKTPITSIKGFVETLIDGAMNDPVEADRFLKIVAKHADRLNAIIEDLLMLSRLEQDEKDSVELQPSELGGLMHAAVEVCEQRAAEKSISITVDCPEKLSSVVNPPLIEQALINLIGNAVKYSADGKAIAVRAKAEKGGVTLSVSDQGYGIEPGHLERLFERFYRVDKGRSRQEGGTGLGLAIVKHIAQVHGGSVSVKSVFGEGSTFSMFLPDRSVFNPISIMPRQEAGEPSRQLRDA